MTAPAAPYRLKACRHGTFLYNPNDRYLGRSLDLYGEFSAGEAAAFGRLLRPGDVAVDVGANIGCHTVAMARRVGETGFVIAVEPQRLLHQMLCANVALNGMVNVLALHQALGAAPGVIRVPVLDPGRVQNFGGLGLDRDDAAGEPVPVRRLDDLGLRRCRLIKIDVEGMESQVLDGARQTVARLRPLLYVENDRVGKSAGLMRRIAGLRYRMYWHCPPLFNPDNHDRRRDNVFGNIVSRNLLCVPRESPARVTGLTEAVPPPAPAGV